MNQPEFFTNSHYETIESLCRLPKYLKKEWKERLCWLYTFPWRPEQLHILKEFQKGEWSLFIIQAIFGGGKTTMIIAMIFDLVLHQKTTIDRIMVSAFNVAIKNEIKKKLKYVGKIVPRTFDSIVWEICNEMKYPLLKDPNFREKRQFLYQNISKIPPCDSIDYIFLDEAQDLERQVHCIFQKRFPNAKFIIVGDIFQSIQKEPRESFLWSLLQQNHPHTYQMTNTPRVPKPILSEIKSALESHYPEFQQNIHQWTSSNRLSEVTGITWNGFSNYGDVFSKMEEFVLHHGVERCMILVFSSAITVRGTLGDVSRVRRFLISKNIPVNANHKQMKDNSLFISTVNSSKGLERDHVFCFLTFPLEMAFSGFSSDILMNLVTVGVSRCKKSLQFHVPSFQDRFSPLLKSYEHCPSPPLQNTFEKSKEEQKNLLNEDYYILKPYMLQREHSITEILQLQILSYNLSKVLSLHAKQYDTTVIGSTSLSPKSEEESTLLGLVFETLIVSSWSNHWPTSLDSTGTIGHGMFHTFTYTIRSLYNEWILFKRRHPFPSCSENQKLQGSILFSRLYLGYYQKIFYNISPSLLPSIMVRWNQLRSPLSSFRPTNLKTQDNVHCCFMNGMIDVSFERSDPNSLLEIVEIKASRKKDWTTTALLQAILYGICKHKSIFRVHLINVLSKSWKHYYVSFQHDFKFRLVEIRDEIQLFNMNCFLCKNRSINDPNKKNFYFEHTMFLDGRHTVEKGWESVYLFEFISPTKVEFIMVVKESFSSFWSVDFPKLVDDLKIKKVIVGRHLFQDLFDLRCPVDFRFLNQSNTYLSSSSWNSFLENSRWIKESEQLPPDCIHTKLNWDQPLSSTSLQISDLCTHLNFVN